MEAPSCPAFQGDKVAPNSFEVREAATSAASTASRGRDDKVVVAASRLQPEPASRSRLEDELSEFPAQKLAAGRMLGANCWRNGACHSDNRKRVRNVLRPW